MKENQGWNAVNKALAIVAVLATVFSCVIAVLAFTSPKTMTEVIFSIAGQTPEPQVTIVTKVVTVVIQPTAISDASTPLLVTTSPVSSTPTAFSTPPPLSGTEKVVLANSDNNTYTWEEGSPYITTRSVYEGDVAFIPTGNNHFSKELGVVGYEQGEVRYITFKLYLLKQDAALLLQVFTDNWEHRWGFDGRPAFQGYGWARKGQTVNLPVGQWIDIRLDLINDLGAKPGQKLRGLAFSGNDGNMIFDRVTLVSDH